MTTTERPAYVSPRWIPTTDVAKLVRKYLKATHPGVKFSVRSDKYSGGSSVRVTAPYTWTRQQERDLYLTLTTWGSSGFDGMTDSSYGKAHYLCPEHWVTLSYVGGHWGAEERVEDPCCANAEPVHMGTSYVQVQRDWQRPDGITRADGARRGDVIIFDDGRTKTVRTTDDGGYHDMVRLFYIDGMNDTFRQDEILNRA